MTPHRDTERVLSTLTEGDTVAITRGHATHHATRWATVEGFNLDGLTVRWIDGSTEAVTVLSATRALPDLPADLEVAQ